MPQDNDAAKIASPRERIGSWHRADGVRFFDTRETIMIAMGWAEVLMLIVMSGGMHSGDLVTYLPADTYFKSRDVPINLDNMIYLAGKNPDSGEAQIKQLMALRYLAEQPDLIKKAKDKTEALATLGKIAKGELANDKQGFAKEYAARVLQIVEGGKESARPAAP